jgi:hypothetical protein
MTLSSLITGLAVGVVFGLVGRWLVPAGRRLPFWVLLAVSVSAAMLGTVVGRLADINTAGVTPVDLILQATFAAAAVSLVTATAERRPPDRRHYPRA